MTIDILAIFAHPDDVELSVGGTLLKMKSLGYKTGALDVTEGEMGTRGTVEGRSEEARCPSGTDPGAASAASCGRDRHAASPGWCASDRSRCPRADCD